MARLALHYRPTVLLTKTWAAILAVLATASLAGMFLLSLGTGGDFSEADRAAIKAVTEAGLAALKAEIQSSPTGRGPALLTDTRLAEALEREDAEDDKEDPEAEPLEQVLADVAEENLLGDNPKMTVGLVDGSGKVLAASGIATASVGEVAQSDPYDNAPGTEEAQFSVTVSGELHVATVSRADEQGRRLIAIQALATGAGSMLRRVLGSDTPAALVRKGTILGDVIGDQPVKSELEHLASEHLPNTPEVGASDVFVIGEGLGARIGALGRVPGPAGRGDAGAVLTVLSRKTAAAGQQDLAEALSAAKDKGLLAQLNWPLLGVLLVVTVGLALYLPSLESTGPMRRLAAEFTAMAQGAQHQLFHDRYGGVTGDVARAAAAAHEALRQAYVAELDIDEEERGDEAQTAPRTRARTGRSRRFTTGRAGRRTTPKPLAPTATEPLGVDLPAAGAAEVERNDQAPAPSPVRTAPTPIPAAPASVPLTPTPASPHVPAAPSPVPAAASPVPAPGAAAPSSVPLTPSPALGAGVGPEPVAAPADPPPDPKEAYYREIYDEFVQVKQTCGESTAGFSYDKFARKLAKNTEDLKSKRPGVKDVLFTVYVKDGKAALKARVVKDSA